MQADLFATAYQTLNYKVGDTDILKLEGKSYEVVVSEIIECGINVIVFDCGYFGIPHNMLLVDGDDGLSDDELLREIRETGVLSPERSEELKEAIAAVKEKYFNK